MKLAYRGIEAFAKNPPAAALAILLYGGDEGLIRERALHFTRRIVPDIDLGGGRRGPADPFGIAEFGAERLLENPSLLLDEAQSISMLGGRRVIRVRDATDKIEKVVKDALAQLKPGCNLVLLEAGELGPRSALRLLFEGAENAAALPCYVDDEDNLARLLGDELREEGYVISSEALAYLAANVVGDRGVARAEADKLTLYMGHNKSIALEDVIASVGGSAVLPLEDLARTAAGGNFAEADRILRHLLSEGEAPVRILRVLQEYLLRLHLTKARLAAGEDSELALKKLRPPVFFKHKDAFLSQTHNWSAAQLEQALLLLMGVEARCKQSGFEPETLLSRAVLSLSQMGARAVPQRRRA